MRILEQCPYRSYGIDYLIGEEAYLGKGFGKEIVTLLVRKVFSFSRFPENYRRH